MKKYLSPKSSEASSFSDRAVAYQKQPLQERLDDYTYLSHIRKGLSAQYYFDMVADSGLSLEDLAKIFHVTSRTLRRIQEGDILDLDLSEKILQLRRLYNVGYFVFGDHALFVDWIHKPLIVLDGDSPLSYLDTSFGIDIILDLLGRIEYGVYS